MIKHKYKMEINGQVFLQTDDLDDFVKEAKRLEKRRTGRSTRMLFKALGSDAENVYIVAHNSVMLKCLIDMFLQMMIGLKLDPLFNRSNRTVTNFGKTYYFVTKEQISNISFHTMPNFETFRDEL